MTQNERFDQLEKVIADLQAQVESLKPPEAPKAGPDGDSLNSIIREVWVMKKLGLNVSADDQSEYQAAVDAGYQPYKNGHADLELFYKSDEYLNRAK